MPSHPPDLDRLLRQARDGDREALGKLLDRFRSYLRLLARQQLKQRLREKLDDSDIIQETYLEAQRDFAQFRGTSESELAAWLRQILAHNLANQIERYYGAQRRDVRLERDLSVRLARSSAALERGLVARQLTPSQWAAQRDQAVLLAISLERLPPTYRQVLELRHIESLTFPQIAQQMNRTEDSVKNLWARALTRLRRELGGDA
jgi:RNA polymerase sigma-70 factor (ECF subfamily)